MKRTARFSGGFTVGYFGINSKNNGLRAAPGWRRDQILPIVQKDGVLHCGKNIGPIRKLRDQEYCSNSHREAHRKKQNALALDFLLKTKPHFALAKSPSISPVFV